jgi:DNA-binding transcriptional MerR regulator
MLIGELSKKTGLSRDTIRFYEKESLIGAARPERKGPFSNTYKNYPESLVSDLSFIQGTKALGFTLAEIKGMLELRAKRTKGSKTWTSKAEDKLLEIDRKIHELQNLKTVLREALERCSDQCLDEGCEVLDGAMAQGAKTGAKSATGPRSPNRNACC